MKLKIVDVSFLPNGTAILEFFDNSPLIIKSVHFNLIINGESKKTIWIESEALINRKDSNQKNPRLRLITTKDLSPNEFIFEKGNWELIVVPNNKSKPHNYVK